MKVRALQLGYHDNKRRRPGDVFELVPYDGFLKDKQGNLTKHHFTAEEQFSNVWMEKLADSAVEKVVKRKKQVEPEPQEIIDEDDVI